MLSKSESSIALGKNLLNLTGPIFVANLSHSLVGFMLTLLAARINQTSLAAVGLGGTFSATITLGMIGISNACAIMVAHAFGAKDKPAITKIVGQGHWLALICSIPLLIGFKFASPIFLWLGQDPVVVTAAQTYLNIMMIGMVPFTLFITFYQEILGLGLAKLGLSLAILSAILTILLGCFFVLGWFGLPNYGIAGLGWAVAVGNWLILTITFFVAKFHPVCREYGMRYHLPKIDKHLLKQLFILGLPVGGLWSLEFAEFFVAMLFAGWLGQTSLAVYQISVQTTLLVYMLPIALSEAVMILVGHAHGARNYLEAEKVIKISFFICGIIVAGLFVLFRFFPETIAGLFLGFSNTNYQQLQALLISVFKVIAIVIIFDSLRLNAAGALRGLKDTRAAMWLGIITFWIIGIPAGYIFAFPLHFGVAGLWCGTVVGTFIGVSMLILRLRIMLNRDQNDLKFT